MCHNTNTNKHNYNNNDNDDHNDDNTPSPPTKSLDFRGFDSSRLLILRGGNSHVRIIL